MNQTAACDVCGQPLQIGDFPFCPHGAVTRHYGKGFEPRWDDGLGEYVTGWGDIHKAMREHHLDFRDHPSKSQTAERLDRIAAQRRSRC